MLEYDSIFTLKDDIIIMKNEIKKLAAVAFSALGALAFSSETFCKSSWVEYSKNNSAEKTNKTSNVDVYSRRIYTACPEDEIKVNMLYGKLKKLVYPIDTFDVERFYNVIYVNDIDRSWDFYIVDNDENPVYGFYVMFIKGDKIVKFLFDPMKCPEKFAGSNWKKDGFSVKVFFDNFMEFVKSFGFKERKYAAVGIENCVVFAVPPEMKCLNDETFKDFKNLEKIIIPTTVEKISENAFECCKNLKTIRFMGRDYSSVKDFMAAFEFYRKNFRSSGLMI